jgi:hypothetical protein
MDFVRSSSKKTLGLPEQVKQDIIKTYTFQILIISYNKTNECTNFSKLFLE